MLEGQKKNVVDEILKELKVSVLTTLEIERRIDYRGARCPDDLAKTLSQMRKKGMISGKLSIEKGTWVWWIEE